MSFHKGFQVGDPNVCSVLVDDRRVSPEMKNKLIVSQSIPWATALLVVALGAEYRLFLLVLLAAVAVVNLNKNS